MPAPDEWMPLGTLTAPWGIRGEIKIRLDADPAIARQVKTVYLGPERRPVAVRGWHQRGRFHTIAFDGIDSVNAAEALRNLSVAIPRADAPALPEGHFFVDQVVGLRAVTTGGREIGRITEVIATGANDVYVVRGPQGEVLIPAIRDVVVEIDVANGLLRVEPMPGLLDE